MSRDYAYDRGMTASGTALNQPIRRQYSPQLYNQQAPRTAAPQPAARRYAYSQARDSNSNISNTSSGVFHSSQGEQTSYYQKDPSAVSYHKDSTSTYDGSVSYTPTSGSRQFLDVQRYPLNDRSPVHNDSDSGIISKKYSPSISSRDADLESLASGRSRGSSGSMLSDATQVTDTSRYSEELYRPRPVAAPRKINSDVRKMFGEKHPRLLRPEEMPLESTDESDTTSIASSTATPTARRRGSTMKRGTVIHFIEDDAILEENKRLKSSLKPEGSISLQRKTVRFEHVDKHKPQATAHYDDIDSDPTHYKPSKNVYAHLKPTTGSLKRDKKRSSGSRGSHRSSSRSRTASRSSRSGSVSSQSSVRSSSKDRGRKPKEQVTTTSSRDIKPMEKPRSRSLVQEMAKDGGSCLKDKERFCKMCLIIGVPVVLLIIIAAVLGGVLGGSSQ